MQLSKRIFWDVDSTSLSYIEHARFIMERAFMRGKTEDMVAVLKYYGLEKVKLELTQSRYLDKKTLALCCTLFDLKKEDFRCYKLSQSTPQHWNF